MINKNVSKTPAKKYKEVIISIGLELKIPIVPTNKSLIRTKHNTIPNKVKKKLFGFKLTLQLI